jgi:hypothetical protein
MIVEQWWNDTDRGKLKNSKGKKPVPVPLCHKSYMHWPGLEPRLHSKQPVSGTATVIMY